MGGVRRLLLRRHSLGMLTAWARLLTASLCARNFAALPRLPRSRPPNRARVDGVREPRRIVDAPASSSSSFSLWPQLQLSWPEVVAFSFTWRGPARKLATPASHCTVRLGWRQPSGEPRHW